MPIVLRSHPAYPPGVKPLEVARSAGEAERPELWRGLQLAIPLVDTGGSAVNVAGKSLVTLKNNASWVATGVGPGISLTGTASAQHLSAQEPFAQHAEEWTWLIWCEYRGVGGTGATALISSEDGTGVGRVLLSIQDATTSVLGSFILGTSKIATTPLVVGRRYLAGISKTGNVFRFWVDGVAEGQFSGTADANDGAVIRIGTAKAGGQAGLDGNVLAVYAWDRAISAGEHQLLAADPFAPLRPASYRHLSTSVPAGVSGAALVAGGGVVTSAGTKATSAAAEIAGGGQVAAVGMKDALGAALVAGGGAVTATGLKAEPAAILGSVLVAGGGTITSTGTKSGLGVVLIPGGGEIGTSATRTSSGVVYVLGGGNVATTGYGPLGPPQSVSTAVVLWRWDRLAESVKLPALFREMNARFVKLQQLLDGVRREGGVLVVRPGMRLPATLTMDAQAEEPRSPPAGRLVLYATKNGGGKMILNVKYPGGTTAVIHTEP